MQEFYQAHKRILDEARKGIKRSLMYRIDSNYRIIGIRGARGVGKTHFLVQYADYAFPEKRCLYVNMNHFYFSRHTLFRFIEQFVQNSGEVLLIDQIFKYPKWAEELKQAYDTYPQLRIIFSLSSVMLPREDFSGIQDIAKLYDLQGFSLREFINHRKGFDFEPIGSIDRLLRHHEQYASNIINNVNPLELYTEYLKVGYYPPYETPALFGERLVKNMNVLMEVDIVYLRQIDPSYLDKLRQLFFLLATQDAPKPNISKISEDIGVSRSTVMNYIRYLSDSGLIRLMYKANGMFPKKPDAIYVNNPNILNVMYPYKAPIETQRKAFLLLHLLAAGMKVTIPTSGGEDFVINDKYRLKVVDRHIRRKRQEAVYAIDYLPIGMERQVPLWLFGFLY